MSPDGEDHGTEAATDATSTDGGVETADGDGTQATAHDTADDATATEADGAAPDDGATSGEASTETQPTDGSTLDDGAATGSQRPDAAAETAVGTATEDAQANGTPVTEDDPTVEAPGDEPGRPDESADDAPDPDPSGEPRAAEVRLSTLFEVLGNERRRHVIQVVREEESVGLADLAEAVAVREHGVDPDDLTRRQKKTTYSALQQTHLPKMDTAGVLTFDKAASEVTAGDAIVEYTMYLDVVPSRGVRRSELYLYVAAAGVVVAAGLWAALPPFAWVPPLVWGGLLVASVAAVAVVQLYHHPLFPDRLPIG